MNINRQTDVKWESEAFKTFNDSYIMLISCREKL